MRAREAGAVTRPRRRAAALPAAGGQVTGRPAEGRAVRCHGAGPQCLGRPQPGQKEEDAEGQGSPPGHTGAEVRGHGHSRPDPSPRPPCRSRRGEGMAVWAQRPHCRGPHTCRARREPAPAGSMLCLQLVLRLW